MIQQLLHRQIAHLKLIHMVRYPFCTQDETLAHVFLYCVRSQSLFSLLKSQFQGLGEHLFFHLFLIKKKDVRVPAQANVLSGTAKLVFRIRIQSVGSTYPLQALQGMVAVHLTAKLCILSNSMRISSTKWFYASDR